jgi:hypothetical protein
MTVTVTKLTDLSLINSACSFTVDKEVTVKDYYKMYRSEHSPIRTQMFWIELSEIPSFVSTHLVRHKNGVEHFVKSLRDDRGGTGDEGRMSPVNHAMLINAQALIYMARKRLCSKAHVETQKAMHSIWNAVQDVDPELAKAMVVDCVYRNGCCEFGGCGFYKNYVEGNLSNG